MAKFAVGLLLDPLARNIEEFIPETFVASNAAPLKSKLLTPLALTPARLLILRNCESMSGEKTPAKESNMFGIATIPASSLIAYALRPLCWLFLSFNFTSRRSLAS
jgi:hypothetical protein